VKYEADDLIAWLFDRQLSMFQFFASALWVGSMASGLALCVPFFFQLKFGMFFLVPLSPMLLFNILIVPNAALLALMCARYLTNDGLGFFAWGMLVAAESVFALLSVAEELRSVHEGVLVLICWLVILTMVETGVWLIYQWRKNIWVRNLFEISAENSMRRAERDAARASLRTMNHTEKSTESAEVV
jgi:hypothetical protein